MCGGCIDAIIIEKKMEERERETEKSFNMYEKILKSLSDQQLIASKRVVAQISKLITRFSFSLFLAIGKFSDLFYLLFEEKKKSGITTRTINEIFNVRYSNSIATHLMHTRENILLS